MRSKNNPAVRRQVLAPGIFMAIDGVALDHPATPPLGESETPVSLARILSDPPLPGCDRSTP